MKALIVDDQMHVYKAIQLQVQWESYGITEVFFAPNGKEAQLIMAEEHPELVFTDMQMPEMDGPQFLRALRTEGYDSEVIAISGYNDFEYVRSVLGANGVDYLLKPLAPDELNTAIKKAMEHIYKKQEAQKEREEIEHIRRHRRYQQIASWLNGEQKYDHGVEESLGALGIFAGNYRVSLMVMSDPDKVLSDIYDGDPALFDRELSHIAGQVFPVNRYLYFFLMREKLMDGMEYGVVMDRIIHDIHARMTAECIYVSSDRAVEVRQLPQMIDDMKARIQIRPLHYVNGKTYALDVRDEIENIDYHEGKITGLSYVIRMAVKDKDMEAIGKIITEFCNGLRAKKQFTLYELQIYTTEINLLLKKLLVESRDVGAVPLRQIPVWIYNPDILEMAVKEAVLEIASCHFENAANITAVRAYIMDNYARNISIPELSEYFSLSPQYLSKLYKNKYGESIGQTLKRIRMEKAKELLTYGMTTIKEIALLTGYEDDNYFSKVFKKYQGISPQQYRKEMAAKS